MEVLALGVPIMPFVNSNDPMTGYILAGLSFLFAAIMIVGAVIVLWRNW